VRRRDLAALLIALPLLVGSVLYLFFPESWDWTLGYMLAASLAFKGAILSFYSASKLKLIAFFKGLTLLQGSLLLIKRWFLDNVFSRWLRRNVLEPVSHAPGRRKSTTWGSICGRNSATASSPSSPRRFPSGSSTPAATWRTSSSSPSSR